MEGPPARWIAPSTPPPPARPEFAALTRASAWTVTMFPWIRRRVVAWMSASVRMCAPWVLYQPWYIGSVGEVTSSLTLVGEQPPTAVARGRADPGQGVASGAWRTAVPRHSPTAVA